MKTLLTLTTLLIFSYTIYGQQANCSSWSDTDWKIGTPWNSTKVSACHANAYYNCNGFVLSYFENGCQPSGAQNPPYLCPNAQGHRPNGDITNNGKVLQVCQSNTGEYCLL